MLRLSSRTGRPRSAGVRLLSTPPSAAANLPTRVQGILERDQLIPAGSPLLVSVSGGADSVALLRVLLALSPRWRWRLHAVHFNHGLRPESKAEEAFVRSLAEEHSVPLHVRRLPPSWADHDEEPGELGHPEDGTFSDGAVGSGGGGLQQRMRVWRRSESLAILAKLNENDDGEDTVGGGVPDGSVDGGGLNGGLVALGHHADDQIETVLLKALRGAHLSNLHGMRPRSGAFVRPLLSLSKSELIAYLDSLGQTWMEDASNASPKYKRNKVRLELVPLLEQLAGGSGGLRARVDAVEEQSSQLREWLEQASRAHLADEPFWQRVPRGLSVSRLMDQVPLLQDELLHTLVRQAGHADESAAAAASSSAPPAPRPPALAFAALRKLRAQLREDNDMWTLDLTRQVHVQRVGDRLTAISVGGAASEVTSRMALRRGVTVELASDAPQWRIVAGWADDALAEGEGGERSTLRVHNLPEGTALELRTWRDGDKFLPSWRRSPVSVASFLRGQDVPIEERRTRPLLCMHGTSEVVAIFPNHVARGFHKPEAGREATDTLLVAVDE